MSFLKKKKAPTQAELLRENKIKKSLTKEFSVSLKNLQQTYHNSDEPVYSNDTANHLCCVLEAVFLHGLKDSVTAKIASYVNFTHDHVNQINTNFWDFVARFTHKDVISQLKHLGQITTDIGLCRAWIRLGLNDGLMESYLDSMTADKKSLDYYYHQVSYLRDIEQPGILKSYMKGLIELEFKLSFNSSVLNNWTHTPLGLAGIVEAPNTPLAVVDSSPSPPLHSETKTTMESSNKKSKTDDESPILVRNTRAKSRDSIGSDTNSTPSLPVAPPNTPFSPSGFTRQDVEEIKKLMTRSDYSFSECSSSSHVSCPDPGHSDLPVPSPRDGFFLSEEIEYEPAPHRHSSHHSSKRRNSDTLRVKHLSTEENGNLDHSSRQSPDHPNSSSNTKPETIPTLDSEKLAQIESDILKVPKELGKEAHRGRRRSRQDELPPFQSLNCSPREKSAPIVAPTLSTAVVDAADHEEAPRRSSIAQVRESINKHTSSPKQTANASNSGNSGNEMFSSPRSFGNNLNNLDSWSSPSAFDSEGHDDDPSDLPRGRTSSTSQQIPPRAKSESFGTLLQNYTPTSTITSTSMDELLQDLERKSVSPTKPSIATISKNELSDSGLEDYEVIPDSDFSLQEDNIIAMKKRQMREIATERGLDAQNYHCNDCKRPIGLFYGKPRVCTFDGGYYCFECHENEEFYIPALVVHNWDFRKQQVSRANMKFLTEHEEDALLDVQEINPKLYDHVIEMQEAKVLRTQLFYLKTYLFTCKQSVAEELRRRIWPREFLYDNIHLYSLGDFFHVYSGQLARSLKEVIKFAMDHVYDCLLCSQKGFICEICSSSKVIYPFQTETTHRCSQCNSVFHKSCMSDKLPCPRCQRWRQRHSKHTDSFADLEDYAHSPET